MYSINKYQVQNQEITFIEVEQGSLKATFMDYGAAIVSIFVPDKEGHQECVVLAYDNLASYIENKRHLNATIGPTAGRINNAQFTIDHQLYTIDINHENKHNLHGGKDALSYTTFDYEVVDEDLQTEIVFKTRKTAGEQLYPGNQQYHIIYTIKDGSITIEFVAETDQATVINLTNHAYFNLSGNLQTNILDHLLQIQAGHVMELNEDMIPVGIKSVQGTALDYRKIRPVKGPDFIGVDDPYMVDNCSIEIPQVTLIEPHNKRRLDVYTTYPSIVCYTDNFPMTYPLLFNAKNEQHMGICFETQNPPNGVNMDGVETSILYPDQRYYQKTIFTFSIEE